jgi:hypothetical protein
MRKKEELTEDMEIRKELETDDITPLQGKVDDIFSVAEEDIPSESSDVVEGLDWTDIAEALNYHINDPELEDAIMQDLHGRVK